MFNSWSYLAGVVQVMFQTFPNGIPEMKVHEVVNADLFIDSRSHTLLEDLGLLLDVECTKCCFKL